jgi:hypothetical protein
MIRLHLLVEGRTEFNFANQVLRPHLDEFNGISLTVSMLTTKRDSQLGQKFSGGSSSYDKLRNEIRLFLRDKSEEFRISTMIDLYGFPHGFPTFSELKHTPYKRVEQIEAKFADDIGDARFIPYVQLHEFESLAFADPSKFSELYAGEKVGIAKLVKTSLTINPEEINDGESTAPSIRIIACFPQYKFEKSSVGATVVQHIGLQKVRDRCPHFSEWLAKLESFKLGSSRSNQ